MILGVGIDFVDMALFAGTMNDPTSAFKKWHFTEKEIAYCEGMAGHDPVLHYAGRYAAKEAFIKACGPLRRGEEGSFQAELNYRDYEVTTDSVSGLQISLLGRAKERLEKFGIKKIFVSISHEKTAAVAIVVLEG